MYSILNFKELQNSKTISDAIFFIFVVALPSSFFALVPKNYFYDLRLLHFLIGVLYLFFYFKYLKKIYRISGGKLLLFLNFFLLFKIIHSLLIQDIPFAELGAIFRTNFFYPVATLGFLLYVSSMSNQRIYRFFKWLIWITFFQAILYILTNLTGINIFAVVSKDFQEFQGQTLLQNLSAIPTYNKILFATGLLIAFTSKSVRKNWFWLVPLIVTVLSIVRSEIIVYSLIIILLIIIGTLANIDIKLGRVIKISFVAFIILGITTITFSAYTARVINKFGFNEAESVTISKYIEEGTYRVRLNLISESYERTRNNGNLLLGNGYQREGIRGEYDFVLGGDTLVPSVLYTEGIGGLIIRIFPVLFFLFWGFKLLKRKNKIYATFGVFIVILIVVEFVNIVQTTIFVRTTVSLFIFYLISMFIYNDKKRDKLIYEA